MPAAGYPSIATTAVTDKLATIAPSVGNVPGYFVWLDDAYGNEYGPSTVTDGSGNWTITGPVPQGIYTSFYSTALTRTTGKPYQGVQPYLVSIASNPATGPYGSKSNVIVYPTNTNLQARGADMSGATASDAAWASCVTDLPSGGGAIYIGPGTPRFASSKTIFSGLTVEGAGTGATTVKATTGMATPLFNVVVPSNGSLLDVCFRDFAIDCIDGPSGNAYGIKIDSTASIVIPYKNLYFERLFIKNAKVGISHLANNSGGGPLTEPHTSWRQLRIENCAYGFGMGGTFGDWLDNISITGCTQVGLCTWGSNWVTLNDGGSGPTTFASIHAIDVQGLGNFASGTDTGISMQLSFARLSDLFIGNTSLGAFSLYGNEPGEEISVDGLGAYGCGGGVQFWGPGATQGGHVMDLILMGCGQNTANWPGGYSQRKYPIAIESGTWKINMGFVALSGLPVTPDYGINCGGVGLISQMSFPVFALGVVAPGSSGLTLRNNPGYNPVGQSNLVPTASPWTYTNADFVDETIYLQGGTVTTLVKGGQTLDSLGGAAIHNRVDLAPGEAFTLTYTVAPTVTKDRR